MNETRNETHYRTYLNKRYRFSVDLGYKHINGSVRPSKFCGKVIEVSSDRLVVFDEVLKKPVTLKFESILSDVPVGEDND